MQGHKPVQKQRTHLGISTSAEGCRHSPSADRDSRLLMLHRKCPNPMVCVRSIPTSSPPSVPASVPFIGGLSPILCQPVTFKPRPRPVVSLSETAQMHVARNVIPSSSAEQSPSRPVTRQRRLPRKAYTGKSHSADGGSRDNPVNPTNDEDRVQDKGQNMDIYIPTASNFLRSRPLSSSKKLSAKADCGDMTGIQQTAYCVDVGQRNGGLRMEHVENPRPLPPRHNIHIDGDSNDISASTSNRQRRDIAFSRRSVMDSELCPSRHLVCDQFPNVSHFYLNERPLHAPPLATDSSQSACFGDTEQTFYRVPLAQKQKPNTVGNVRTVSADYGALQRCSSVQQVLQSTDIHRRRRLSWKNSVTDVGMAVPCGDGGFNRQGFGSESRTLLNDDSSDRTDSISVQNKYCYIIICKLIFLFLLWLHDHSLLGFECFRDGTSI